MIDEEGRNCTVVATGAPTWLFRSLPSVPPTHTLQWSSSTALELVYKYSKDGLPYEVRMYFAKLRKEPEARGFR